METKTLFDRSADVYAQARPRYPSALYEWLAGCCGARRSVWDVGCGNGQAAADLKDYFDLVEATDVSAAQVACAPAYDRVHFSAQPAEATSFSDESFDAVCVAQALHWFDHEKFWPEVMRVLRPAGVFAAWGYNWPHIDAPIDAALADSFLSVIRPFWAPQNTLLWDRYRDISLPFKKIKCPRLELTMSWDMGQFFAYLLSWSATRLCIGERGDGFFVESRQRLEKLWGAAAQRKISMELVMVAGKKT